MGRTILKISGGDHRDFLQGLVTNDVAKLKDGILYAALLTPQGKYLADFFLVPFDDAVLLDVKSELAAGLKQRLMMYKLRADVLIEEEDLHLHRGLGALPQDGYADPRHPGLGWRAYRNTEPEDSAVDWDKLRVGAGVPETGIELIPNDSFILEMGFERLNGVDFRKGCYVGQEVTARMKHKTELRKGLSEVVVEGSASTGDEITAGGKSVGKLLTRSGDRALAYLRFDRAEGEMSAGNANVRRT